MEQEYYQHIIGNIHTSTKRVIPQVRIITRYGTKSVILFDCAESPPKNVSKGDSEQANSHDTFLSRFVLLFGMTEKGLI